jgi:calmodulin-lysine N-methyltransferase
MDNLQLFKGTWILELGGGMSCMASLFLAKYAEPYLVHLTDGNHLSVENIKKSIRLNDFNCFTKCSVLKWEQTQRKFHPVEMGKYDFILSADCIFFDDSRNALIDTINYYLSAMGQAFVMAPKRGHTLNTFVTKSIAKGFTCEVFDYYNQHIWNKHQELLKTKEYNEDIHYPILIKMTRSK